MCNPLTLGARLQHGRATVCCSAADDDGHAPALDERIPLDAPALGEIVQHSGQRIEPRVDGASEPTSETQAQLLEARARLAAYEELGPLSVGVARRLSRLSHRYPVVSATVKER